MSSVVLKDLKQELSDHLVKPEQVKSDEGLPTGHAELDHFTLWKGLPPYGLSLFCGERGLGASTLWTQTAAYQTQNRQWVAWVNASEETLCPWSLQKYQGDLSYLLNVSGMKTPRQLLWTLSELMSQSMFRLIGCDLGQWNLSESQLLKLKKQARSSYCSLVFIKPHTRGFLSASYSLALHFQSKHIFVQRALHKPTPYRLERSPAYAHFMPAPQQKQLTYGG